MHPYVVAQLAQIRREELIADATLFRQTGTHRTHPRSRSGSHPKRRLAAFQAWLAAGQL